MRTLAATLLALAFGAHAAPDPTPIPLTGEPGLLTLDYFAWDAAHRRLWIPGGNAGAVFVLDAPTATVTRILGFPTAEFALGTRRGRLGPASVAVGEGVVYIGNRADSSLCIVDAATLARGECVRIAPASLGWAGAPDGVVYVAATRELWVTRGAPPLGIASADRALTIYDVSQPRRLVPRGRMVLGASAEGYAVDPVRGRLYTNLEESGATVAIDVRRRKVTARWKSGCDEARGLALDAARGILFVACSSRVVALDVAHGGRVLGSLDTGEGLDNIDYDARERLVYAAAATAAELTVARVGDDGRFTVMQRVATAKGARGVVAAEGTAYVADPYGARVLAVIPRSAGAQP
jgi:hypothetical protein